MKKFFVLFCLIVDLIALLILIRGPMRSGQHISELVCEGTDRLQVCTGNNCRTVVGGAAWGKQVTEGSP